uniref:Protein lifeguard 1-like n=1 Tax=Parastrongyloides trichosuri TaxID=131310 RepID=A0A0N5A2Z2_PARTI
MAYSYNGQQPPYPPNAGYNPQGQNPYQQMNPPPQAGWNQSAYVPPPPRMNYGHATETGQGDKRFDFTEASIRAAFVRKVFTMVSIMLLVVAIMTAVPFMHTGVKTFVRQSPAIYFCSYGVFMVVYIALMCCESVRRSFPANLICTAVLTLSIGYMTMMICSMYDIVPVLLTLIITTVCCGGIIIFSMQSKHDLTSKMGYLFIASMAIMVFGFVAIIAAAVFKVKFLYTIYSGLAALLFMFYLAVDIQMLMGGKKYELSPEDHIFAAIQIFIDIVYIFWMLLNIIGGSSR